MSEGKKRHLRFFFAEECLKSCFIFTQSQNLSLQSLFFLPHLISCRLVTSIRDLHCHHVSSAEDRTLPHWKYIQKTQLHKLGVNSVSQSELHLSSGILVPRAVSAQLSNVSNLSCVNVFICLNSLFWRGKLLYTLFYLAIRKVKICRNCKNRKRSDMQVIIGVPVLPWQQTLPTSC